MPVKTDSAPARKPNLNQFELPALEFNFSSLTEGTGIPPPLPSPVKEVPTPPHTPAADENKENKTASNANGAEEKAANGASSGQKNGTVITTGTKRPADDTPLSPTLSSRQGSIRRLFSRTLLNNNYVEGESDAISHASGRPGSRSNTSILDEKKAKRGSGWFRRLRSGADNQSKRSSGIYEEVKKPAGPPPPMIPELSALEAKVDVNDEGSFGGGDLFKNIK